jgi:hypothetical protein|tara:strand:- start:353 stop:625 length:273 start_codon:yes stop_codon:yes gene_type:complete
MVTQYEGVPLMKIEDCTMRNFYTSLEAQSYIPAIAKLRSKIRYAFQDNQDQMTTKNIRRSPGVSAPRAKEIFELAEKMGYKVLKLQTVYI